jgi:hypothetical protein
MHAPAEARSAENQEAMLTLNTANRLQDQQNTFQRSAMRAYNAVTTAARALARAQHI